jgi:hypothetical protein
MADLIIKRCNMPLDWVVALRRPRSENQQLFLTLRGLLRCGSWGEEAPRQTSGDGVTPSLTLLVKRTYMLLR